MLICYRKMQAASNPACKDSITLARHLLTMYIVHGSTDKIIISDGLSPHGVFFSWDVCSPTGHVSLIGLVLANTFLHACVYFKWLLTHHFVTRFCSSRFIL